MAESLSVGYLANKRYRAKHPERRNTNRKKNYGATGGPEKNPNHREEWTLLEINTLETWLDTDRTLHLLIGRSVQAIQKMRYKLRRIGNV